MKKRFIFKPAVPLLATAFFALAACNDPIFYTISQEVAPIEPLIKGGPTNFAVWNDVMYVASGNTLHWYKEGVWDSSAGRVPRPGGRINLLAASTKYLYALCYRGDSVGSSDIKRIGTGWTEWETLKNTTSYHLRSIYVPDPVSQYVFIGAEIGNTFAVLYTDDTDVEIRLTSISGDNVKLLCGAVYDGTYYLCTEGGEVNGNLFGGIYYANTPPTFQQVSDTAGKEFRGIIKLGSSYIAAIERKGRLYKVSSSGIIEEKSKIPNSYLSTGALAIWEDSSARLLLAGQQSNMISVPSYSNGYVELTLDTDGKPISDFREPGGSPSSVVDGGSERYKSTIGRLPIIYMFQAPPEVDSGMRLFASTSSGGVWSYRIRNGIYQWNAED